MKAPSVVVQTQKRSSLLDPSEASGDIAVTLRVVYRSEIIFFNVKFMGLDLYPSRFRKKQVTILILKVFQIHDYDGLGLFGWVVN